MGLDNINASSLRSAIAQCKSSLNYSNENQILSEIANESIWKCNSKSTLSKGIKDLIKEIDKLKVELDSCNVLADYVDQYQKYESENASLKKQKNSAKNKRSLLGNDATSDHPDEFAKYSKTISNCDKKINANSKMMEELEKKASNIL